MPSLKDLKLRIDSVKSTRKITKAMQMVAAAKLRKAQEIAESSRPYAERMNRVLSNLANGYKDNTNAPKLLQGTGREDTFLFLVATSERGLCGGFNSSIVKLAKLSIQGALEKGKKIKIITIGKKGKEQLSRDYNSFIIDHIDLSGMKKIEYELALKIAKDVINKFEKDEFDVVKFFYARFQSVISQIPEEKQLVPAKLEESNNVNLQYDYEPDEDVILADLLPRSITTQIFTGLLENAASEQGARMSAMDNATRNAGDMIDRLTIQFNRSRQAAITNELIEIISGAEAL